MHIRKEPSFFFTNNIGAPHGEKLGLINPLLNSSWSWLESSCISEGASLYGALAIGAAPGIKSILNSTCRFGGNPGRSSGNTSGKSQTSGMSWIFLTSLLLSTMCAKKAGHFFCRYFCALMHDTIRRLSPDLSPYTIIERTRDTSLVRDGLPGSQCKHPAVSCSRCLGAVPLEVTSVTTSITGPVGTYVDNRGWSYWGPSTVTGSVPFLLAFGAGKFSAGAGVVKVAFVAPGEVSPVLFLGCHGVDGYSSIGSTERRPLSDGLVGHANGHTLDALVRDPQSAFVVGRQILDGPLILNEVVSWCKAKKKKAMVFKVDFEKAYDSVRWDFLLDILEAFGFGANWCRWIRGCLTSSMGSALVNGSATEEFQFQRGLRQGGPISPFLFVLVMEVLHISMHRAMEQGFFRPLRIGDTLHISHLFYADDAVFIGEWREENFTNIVSILQCFFLASSLKINIQKSKILGICVSGVEVEQVANLVGCAPLKLPFTYLGVKVGGVMSRSTAWEEVAKKLTAKLSNWKLKTLSVGGRLTLIKSVLGSLPIYNMSLFKVLMGVLKTLEQLRSRFFRGVDHAGNKMAWISWDKVCASKEKGGLGVGSFYALNRALLFKWVWRFKSQPCAFWVTVVKAIHGSEDPIGCPRASVWRDILRSWVDLVNKGIDLKHFCKKVIDDGVNTRFWKEVWLGNYMLHTAFPRLFALEEDKDVSVAAKFIQPWNASFRRPMLGGAEEAQGQELSALLDTGWKGWLDGLRLRKKLKEVLEGVFFVTWWSIWKFRNQLLFGSVLPRKSLIYDDIVSSSYMWCSNRSDKRIDWRIWMQNPSFCYFFIASGLKVNLNKSKVFGVGVEDADILNLANILGCEPGKFPFTYLGVPLGANMRLSKHWSTIVDKFRNKLTIWKARNLSFAGRLTLIKSVLGSLPLYFLSLFRAPKKVINCLEGIRRNFLWGGYGSNRKIHWVAWNQITLPNQRGGLGVAGLEMLNLALLAKWISRYKNENNSLWKNCIQAWHNVRGIDGKPITRASLKGMWLSIANVDKVLADWDLNMDRLMMRKLGNGKNTHFWKDKWIDDHSLNDLFPELYRVEDDKDCKVADRLKMVDQGEEMDMVWNWKRNLRRGKESTSFHELKNKLNNVIIDSDSDSWMWPYNKDGKFSAYSLRMQMVDKIVDSSNNDNFNWMKWIPLKINCFVWRLRMNRIPLSNNLVHRGIGIASQTCKLCLLEEESVDHVFFRCEFACDVWNWLCNWTGMLHVVPMDFPSFIDCVDSVKADKRKFKLIISLGYTVLWLIWKERNERFFGKRIRKPMQIADDIQLLSFGWIKNRGNFQNLDWNNWCCSPTCLCRWRVGDCVCLGFWWLESQYWGNGKHKA
ncbi:hypothetical protein LXL04_009630 [Taraxacum kok-saghyz]